MSKVIQFESKANRNSREDWLKEAHALLISQGMDAVKIMPLAKRLGTSRTSFYWHFEDRQSLLDALLHIWHDTNTETIIRHCELPAKTIAQAVLNIFYCWTRPGLFDERLDFAVRSWAAKSQPVRALLDQNDRERIEAITKVFLRFAYEANIADVRARTLYYTQIGYYALECHETFEERMDRIGHYVKVFSGKSATNRELSGFRKLHES